MLSLSVASNKNSIWTGLEKKHTDSRIGIRPGWILVCEARVRHLTHCITLLQTWREGPIRARFLGQGTRCICLLLPQGSTRAGTREQRLAAWARMGLTEENTLLFPGHGGTGRGQSASLGQALAGNLDPFLTQASRGGEFQRRRGDTRLLALSGCFFPGVTGNRQRGRPTPRAPMLEAQRPRVSARRMVVWLSAPPKGQYC